MTETFYPRIRVQAQPATPRIRLRVLPALVPLDVSMQNTGVVIQWRVGAGAWQDLLTIDDINASVTIGTVTTLAAGSAATVQNVGTAQDVVLNFGIPSGFDGGVSSVNGHTGVVVLAASDIAVTPTGNIASTNVQTALAELDTEKIATTVLDTDVALAANSDAKVATQKATKAYVDQIVAAQDAMVFKGVIDCSANPNYPAADRGWTYRVSVAGKIGGASGTNVEIGDILMCLTDGTASGTQAGVGAAWSIIQANIDGAVTGPASATGDNIATFNGATGKIIKDSGKAAPTGTIVGTTDTQTLSNKRNTPRIGTTASSATPTPDGDNNDEFTVTALAAGATFAAPTGTPNDGQKLIIRIKDNASPQTLAYNAIYRAVGVTLPTVTVASKTLYLGCIYNTADTKWDVVAVAQQA